MVMKTPLRFLVKVATQDYLVLWGLSLHHLHPSPKAIVMKLERGTTMRYLDTNRSSWIYTYGDRLGLSRSTFLLSALPVKLDSPHDVIVEANPFRLSWFVSPAAHYNWLTASNSAHVNDWRIQTTLFVECLLVALGILIILRTSTLNVIGLSLAFWILSKLRP